MLRSIVAAIVLACAAAALSQGQAPPAQPATPLAAAPAPTVPALSIAWKEPFDQGALRIAVADTVGDGLDRVVALGMIDEGHSGITVYRWNGKRFVAEWRREFEDTQRLVVAGRFVVGAKDAQIVTSSGWYRWTGSDYAYHPFKGAHPPVGLVRRPDGSAVLLTWERGGISMGSLDVTASAEGGALVAEPEDAAAVWTVGLLRSRADYLKRLAPKEYAAHGLLAFWMPARSQSRLNALPVDGDKDSGTSIAVTDSMAPDTLKELLRSPPLPGAIMDLAFGDPKGLRTPVLLALAASGPTGAGRVLVAFPTAEPAPLLPPTTGASKPKAEQKPVR